MLTKRQRFSGRGGRARILEGLGWKDLRQPEEFADTNYPKICDSATKLPEPILTPRQKTPPVTMKYYGNGIRKKCGSETAAKISSLSLRIYKERANMRISRHNYCRYKIWMRAGRKTGISVNWWSTNAGLFAFWSAADYQPGHASLHLTNSLCVNIWNLWIGTSSRRLPVAEENIKATTERYLQA